MGKTAPKILVYCPDSVHAERYRELILNSKPDTDVSSASNEDEASKSIDKAEILLGWQVPPMLFKHAVSLRWMHKTGAGVDDLTLGNVLPMSVRLTRTSGKLLAPRMIEYVLGAIFSHTQKFHQAWTQQNKKVWKSFPVDRAEGSVLGVAGLGDIGEAIAQRAVLNGLNVIGWRRTFVPVSNIDKVYVGKEQIHEFVSKCDYLVLVLPHTSETHNLINADILRSIKPGCFLINVGRGGLVDEPALINALKSGVIAGAMLDVYKEEPLPASHAFWTLPNLYMTPHVAGPIVPDDIAPFFLENLDRYCKNIPLLREVNRQNEY